MVGANTAKQVQPKAHEVSKGTRTRAVGYFLIGIAVLWIIVELELERIRHGTLQLSRFFT